MIQLTSLIHDLIAVEGDVQSLLSDITFIDTLYDTPGRLHEFLSAMSGLYKYDKSITIKRVNDFHNEVIAWLSSKRYVGTVHRTIIHDLLYASILMCKLYKHGVNQYPYIFTVVIELTNVGIIEYFVDEYAKILRTNSDACFIASV